MAPRHGFNEARLRAAHARAGHGRPGVLRRRPRRSCRRSTCRSPTSSPTSTSIGYVSKNTKHDGDVAQGRGPRRPSPASTRARAADTSPRRPIGDAHRTRVHHRRRPGRPRPHHRARRAAARRGGRRRLRPRGGGGAALGAARRRAHRRRRAGRARRRAGRDLDARSPRRRATATPSRVSSGATRSCSTAAPRKRCSCTSRACRSKSCRAFRRRSARRPTPACRSPTRAPATRSSCSAATRTETDSPPDVDWSALAQLDGTLVCYAGGRARCRRSCSRSSTTARRPTTSAALIYRGTQPAQRTVSGTIDELLDASSANAGRRAPRCSSSARSTVLRDHLRWFDERPLFGRRIVVTRSREQARELVEALENLGAQAIEAPTFRLAPPEDPEVGRPRGGVGRRLRLGRLRVGERGRAVSRGAGARTARPARARPRVGLRDRRRPPPSGSRASGIKPDVVVPEFRVESIGDALGGQGPARRPARAHRPARSPARRAGGRPRAARRERDGPRRVPHGAGVRGLAGRRRTSTGMLLEGQIDAVTFTSPTAVRALRVAHRPGAGRRPAQHDGRRRHRPGHGRAPRRSWASRRRSCRHVHGRWTACRRWWSTSDEERRRVQLQADRRLSVRTRSTTSRARRLSAERRQHHVAHRPQARRGACSTFGIELTMIDAVAMSPWTPPAIFIESGGLPAMRTAS